MEWKKYATETLSMLMVIAAAKVSCLPCAVHTMISLFIAFSFIFPLSFFSFFFPPVAVALASHSRDKSPADDSAASSPTTNMFRSQ